MRLVPAFVLLAALLAAAFSAFAGEAPLSEASEVCLDCHASVTPGIVADWQGGGHARTTPAQALSKPPLERRVSAETIPPALMDKAVSCAECHVREGAGRPDAFDHEGYRVHTVVSPPDCALCHPVEAREYEQNIMSRAWGNLARNPLFSDLAAQINGVLSFREGRLETAEAGPLTEADSCFYCHGTEVKVAGERTLETDYGDFVFPVLTGWPNHGVGRVNPDGSLGSCAACHSRHRFSIEMARKPSTCGECHQGPDVPAAKVYEVSKHGGIYSALGRGWDFEAVPWTVGRDFSAPTCAACHISLVVDSQGEIVARRTHRINDRLFRRLFGLVYSHLHPIDPDTSLIRDKDGLPLPVSLDGQPAATFLISPEEAKGRREAFMKVCLSCHSTAWTKGHFDRLDHVVRTADQLSQSATQLMLSIWQDGLAEGPPQGASPFDEAVERLWVEEWLFYANSIRLAAAMAGADYGVFAGGRFQATQTLQKMYDWLRLRKGQPKP